MRLASFTKDGRASYGLVRDNGVIDLGGRFGADIPDLRSLIGSARWPQLVAETDALEADFDLDAVTLAPVIPNPPRIFCIGLNYLSHREETGRAATEHPTIFLRVPESLTAHGAPILRPTVSHALDFEGELAVVIGKGGRYVSESDSLSHVAGYSCFNDATLRDWQAHTTQFTPGKNFAGTGAFGPWMITPDVVAPIEAGRLQTRLNGQVVQQANFDLFIYPIPRLISYISAFTPLQVGDVICTGTPGGVGFKRVPPLFMAPGDTVEVEISGIGVLRNAIAQDDAGYAE